MRRALVVVVLLAVPRGALGQEGFGKRVDVAVVVRQVRVLDQKKCIAAQVRPGDLMVFAGGRALPTSVRRSEGPLRLLVVIDASFSMVGKRLALAELVGRRLLERFAGDGRQNIAGVVVFDEEVVWLTPEGFTSDLCGAAERVTEPVAGGGTALWKALDAALDVAELLPSSRPTAIVVVTDGQDNTDRSGEVAERFRRRALALEVPLFAVAIPPRQYLVGLDDGWDDAGEVRCSRADWLPRGLDRERARLLRACTETGGAMYAPRRSDRIGELVDFLVAQIRDLHWVEAEIPADLAGRDVPFEVAAVRPGLTVLAGPPRRR